MNLIGAIAALTLVTLSVSFWLCLEMRLNYWPGLAIILLLAGAGVFLGSQSIKNWLFLLKADWIGVLLMVMIWSATGNPIALATLGLLVLIEVIVVTRALLEC